MNETWYGFIADDDLRGWRGACWRAAVAIDRLSRWARVVAMILIAALALLTAGLVIAKPLGFVHNGLEELKWHLYGAAFLLGIAVCFQGNGHVRVDTLYGHLRPRVRAAIDLAGICLCLLPFAGLVIAFGIDAAWDSLQLGERSSDANGLGALWVIKAVIPLGFVLLAVQALAQLARCVIALCTPLHGSETVEGQP